MSNSKTTWPPQSASLCQAINGYGRACTNMASHSVCEGQMAGFCGVHMNTSFTVAIVLKLVAQDLRDDRQPDLADAMLKKYGVHPDKRMVPLPETTGPLCPNGHGRMYLEVDNWEGTVHRCSVCEATIERPCE